MAVKRIQRELMGITQGMDQSSDISIHVVKDDNGIEDFFHWQATLRGPDNSPYSGGTFKIDIHFPPDYPFKPFKISFATKIYHCNISSAGGVHMDLIGYKWSPAWKASTILSDISLMLAKPRDDGRDGCYVDADVAKVFTSDRAQYDATAREWTAKFAMEPSQSATQPAVSVETAPILIAAREGNLSEIKILIDSGQSANVSDSAGSTPLEYAGRSGNNEIIRMLVDAGAHANSLNFQGQSPLNVAAANGHAMAAKILIEAGGVIEPTAKITFDNAVSASVQEALLELLHSMRWEAQLHQYTAQFRSWQRKERDGHSGDIDDADVVVTKLYNLIKPTPGLGISSCIFIFVSGTFNQSLLKGNGVAAEVLRHKNVLLRMVTSIELQRHLIASFGWLLSVKYPTACDLFADCLATLRGECIIFDEVILDWYCACRRDEYSALSMISAECLERLLYCANPLLVRLTSFEASNKVFAE